MSKKPRELYQQAIDISPDYALAWARLGERVLRSKKF